MQISLRNTSLNAFISKKSLSFDFNFALSVPCQVYWFHINRIVFYKHLLFYKTIYSLIIYVSSIPYWYNYIIAVLNINKLINYYKNHVFVYARWMSDKERQWIICQGILDKLSYSYFLYLYTWFRKVTKFIEKTVVGIMII